MKTHFIFNYSVFAHPDVPTLITELLKNALPVFIISDQLSTNQLKRATQLDGLPYYMGSDQAENLQSLYLKACPDSEELQYLTVVFANTRDGIRIAKDLGLYVVEIKSVPMQKILKKLKVTEVHQLQYLPEVKKIKYFLKHKLGYPASLYQSLRGYFSERGMVLNLRSKKLAGEPLLDLGNFNFFINNPGDPFFFSKNYLGHTCVFEQEVIRILGQYYGLPADQARGFVTSGGTEGNFAALWWARDNLNANPATRLGRSSTPIALFFSEASHYSIPKIAGQLGLERHVIPAYPTEEINLGAFADLIKQHMQKNPQSSVIFNANIGTTKIGAIDDVPAIKKILESQVSEKGGYFSIHLDAACLGAVLPLLKPFDMKVENYFADLGVSTIAISAHKFFGMSNICGVVLTTKKFLDESTQKVGMEIPYVGRIHDITPSGSRSGNNVLQIHNILYMMDLHTDQNRLKKILSQCQENCQYFYQQLLKICDKDKILWLDNSFSIIFPKPSEFLIRKFSLMPVPEDRVGIYGLANLDKRLTDLFIKEYKRELHI